MPSLEPAITSPSSKPQQTSSHQYKGAFNHAGIQRVWSTQCSAGGVVSARHIASIHQWQRPQSGCPCTPAHQLYTIAHLQRRLQGPVARVTSVESRTPLVMAECCCITIQFYYMYVSACCRWCSRESCWFAVAPMSEVRPQPVLASIHIKRL